MLNASFSPPAAQSTFGWYGTLDQGIPLLADPDFSTRPPPAAEHPRHPDGRAGIGEPRQDALVERRVRAAPAARLGRRRVRGQPVARRAEQGQRQPGAAHGRRRGGSSVLRLARPAAADQRVHALRQDGLQRAAGRRHAAAHARAAAQGALHLRQHWSLGASATSYELPTAEAQDRNWNPTRRQPAAYRHDVLRVPASVAERRDGLQQSSRAIINDWQVNGIFQAFSGAPFTVTADGTALNTPGNTQTADLVGHRDEGRRDRRRRVSTSIRPRGRSRRASASAHRG